MWLRNIFLIQELNEQSPSLIFDTNQQKRFSVHWTIENSFSLNVFYIGKKRIVGRFCIKGGMAADVYVVAMVSRPTPRDVCFWFSC